MKVTVPYSLPVATIIKQQSLSTPHYLNTDFAPLSKIKSWGTPMDILKLGGLYSYTYNQYQKEWYKQYATIAKVPKLSNSHSPWDDGRSMMLQAAMSKQFKEMAADFLTALESDQEEKAASILVAMGHMQPLRLNQKRLPA